MEPFFIEGSQGRLLAVYHLPERYAEPRGVVLFVPPFAEELNKSRYMVARQAERFAAAGFAVVRPDLYGCGDSEGEFVDARWEIWRADLHRCVQWALSRHTKPVSLWGLRLGTILAVELAEELEARGVELNRLLLWQPILSGKQLLTQFLRLRLVADMLGQGTETTKELRQRLAVGEVLEVAGYALHPELAAAMEARVLRPPPKGVATSWFELVSEANRPASPAAQKTTETWRVSGRNVILCPVLGDAFWATQEIATAPALWDVTVSELCKMIS